MRALYILKYLWLYTDDEHPASIGNLAGYLAENANAVPYRQSLLWATGDCIQTQNFREYRIRVSIVPLCAIKESWKYRSVGYFWLLQASIALVCFTVGHFAGKPIFRFWLKIYFVLKYFAGCGIIIKMISKWYEKNCRNIKVQNRERRKEERLWGRSKG